MSFTVTDGQMVSIIVEGVLYGMTSFTMIHGYYVIIAISPVGFSLFMFGITLWAIVFRKLAGKTNWVMGTISCLLFILGTMVAMLYAICNRTEH